ncbi:hypothetical protein GCM10010392_69050 [Streptomyces clavifer]|uniref:hypothetical protein n=1 Tax=Streptomyces clavifer TaxID=68188 RepID=UPI00199F84E8|nr:hypothetical protein [Streptomyces clavifer]GHB32928.1 hypothetical protein GCM10010392_69050 [Streptomyces clavifer]
MARRFPFNLPSDQAKKSDQDAMYELVSLGTQYSEAVVAFSERVQSRSRGKEKLLEEIDGLQMCMRKSNREIVELKQQNKALQSLLTSAVRLPNPLDKDDTMTEEKLKQLKEEARLLKFL